MHGTGLIKKMQAGVMFSSYEQISPEKAAAMVELMPPNPNPMRYSIRVCSCPQCLASSRRRFKVKAANRRVRHKTKLHLHNLSDYDAFTEIMIAGGHAS